MLNIAKATKVRLSLEKPIPSSGGLTLELKGGEEGAANVLLCIPRVKKSEEAMYWATRQDSSR